MKKNSTKVFLDKYKLLGFDSDKVILTPVNNNSVKINKFIPIAIILIFLTAILLFKFM